jgi:transposase
MGTVMDAVAQLRRRGELPPARERARAALLANVGAGLTDEEVARRAGVSRVTVTRTRNRMERAASVRRPRPTRQDAIAPTEAEGQ